MKNIIALILSFSLIASPVTAAASATDKYRSQTAEGRLFYVKQVGLVATALAGSNMATCVPGSYHWSHYIFMVGALSIVVGEIDSAIAGNDYHRQKKESLKIDDDRIVRPHGPQGYVDLVKKDNQTAALKAAKAEEEHNLKIIKRKKLFTDIAKISYTLASVSAFVEGGLSLFPMFTGFTPDILTCGALLSPPLMLGLTGAYSAMSASQSTNGKIGIDMAAFLAVLQMEMAIVAGIASASVTTGWGRGAYFGAASALAFNIGKSLGDRKQIAEQNIGKLNALIAQWEATTQMGGGVAQGVSMEAGGGNSAAATNYLQSAGAESQTPVKCFGKSSQGLEMNSSSCSSPFQFSSIKLPEFKIDGLSSITKDVLAYGDMIAKGDMKGAEISGEALLASAGRLKEIQDKVVKDANEKRKEKGLAAIDFDASVKEKYDELVGSMQKEAEKSGQGPWSNENLAKETQAGSSSNEKSAPTESTASGKIAAFASPVTPTLSVLDSKSSVEESDSTGLTDEEKDVIAANYDRNRSRFEPKEEDGLFKVVSKAYVRNLERILVRKKKIEDF